MKTPLYLARCVVALLSLLAGACSSYVAPGGPADLSGFTGPGGMGALRNKNADITNPQVREGFAAKPAANFPAVIAPVRLQN